MSATDSLATTVHHPPAVGDHLHGDALEQLGEAIAELAARLHAATYELLVLLREFDARAGWGVGFSSCAHWLQWRTGIDLGAAREKVRVARALATLPEISAAMRRGALSYAKVRALTRVATAQTEARLLGFALAGTAAQVERLVRAWRRVDRVEAAKETAARHRARYVTTWVDEDGMLVVRGRLPPEVGAVVQRALEAAVDRLRRDSAGAPGDGDLAGEVTPGQRRADALGLIAEAALAADLDPGSAGDRYQVVLHVEAKAGPTVASADRAGDEDEAGVVAALECGDAAVHVSAETSRRLACDAALVRMTHAADGAVLDVARKTRSIPPAIRRALEARDRCCQFPGCTARRWCDAHHVQSWADGGPTRLENLVLVCRRHHRELHEGGFTLTRGRDGTITVRRPDGRPLPVAPPLPRWDGAPSTARDDGAAAATDPLHPLTAGLAAAGLTIGPRTVTPWEGTRLDVVYALDVLYVPAPIPASRH